MQKTAPLVLIVDDEPGTCWALENIIGRLPARCVLAGDGESALRLVRKERFSLAVLDAKLPDTEGLELAREIRKLDPAVRALLVSAYFDRRDPAVRAAIEERLICDFLGKPFLHWQILEAVEAALDLVWQPRRHQPLPGDVVEASIPAVVGATAG